MPKIAVSLQKVTISKGRFFSLKDFSLDIAEGKTQVIIGQNGAGKSTLLKLINGLTKPRHGRVVLSCKKNEIGYIPQNMGLVKSRSVWENVMQGALGRIGNFRAFLKWFPEEEKKQAAHLLSTLELTKREQQKVGTLSGGEQRRVAIARALMQQPKILLADEIFSDLDFTKAQLIIQKLKELKKEFNFTIVMVEHDFRIAKEMGDDIALLSEGKLKKKLTRRDLYKMNLCDVFTE